MNTINKLMEAASFAAQRHAGQHRLGDTREPYINHPLEVANLLANVGGVDDIDILIAGILHDTVEDVGVTKEEIVDRFGNRVAGFVMEVTDDMSLPKRERRRLQVEHAPHLSHEAKQIKLADKTSNIADITDKPPVQWSTDRRRQYIEWGEEVVAGLRGANSALERYFDETVSRAKLSLGDAEK